MHPGAWWYVISSSAYVAAALALIVSGLFVVAMVLKLAPLLDETRRQIQDLGDLGANTVGRASDAMDLVEIRVSQAMGQAADGGKAATQQALTFGSVVAGVYFVARSVAAFRNRWGGGKPRARRRR